METRIRWDSRDDLTFPADGWLIELSGTRQVGGSLQLPPTLPADADPDANPFGPPVQLDPFMVGTVDVRRYARVGPTSRLSLRAFGAGSLRREPVAPQAQMALGGEGSLPGHPRFSLDCGARLAPRLARTGEGSSGRTIGLAGSPGEAAQLLRAEASSGLTPDESGSYYYLGRIEIGTLSLSDLEESRRWLRGELAPAVGGDERVGGALARGMRRLFVRALKLPAVRYETRTPDFDWGG